MYRLNDRCGPARSNCCLKPATCFWESDWKFPWCCQGIDEIALGSRDNILAMLNETSEEALEKELLAMVTDSAEDRSISVPDAAVDI